MIINNLFMERDESTLRANFRIIVFLYSNLQGLFAFHNIRLQLKHTKFSKYSIEIIKEQLQIIKPFLEKVKSGSTLFGATENNLEEKTNLREVNASLEKLKLLLSELATEVEPILNEKLFYNDKDKVADAVASLSFKAYSRDNYARCHLEIEDQLKRDGAYEMFQELATLTKSETKQVHGLLTSLKKPEELLPDFYEYIRFFARTSPALMRCNIHDINQFLVYTKEPFSFANGDFSVEEENYWARAGFGALESGYWRACAFDTDMAIEWSRAGVPDPIIAYEWKAAGFRSEITYPWLSLNFTPFLALQWVRTGLHPQICLVLTNKGYASPAQLPKGEALEKLMRSILPNQQR